MDAARASSLPRSFLSVRAASGMLRCDVRELESGSVWRLAHGTSEKSSCYILCYVPV